MPVQWRKRAPESRRNKEPGGVGRKEGRGDGNWNLLSIGTSC